LKFVEGDHFRD